jgi:hypothetical protein
LSAGNNSSWHLISSNEHNWINKYLAKDWEISL